GPEELDELRRRAHGQIAQDEEVEQTEDRGVGSERAREDDERNGGQDGCAPKRADGVTRIEPEIRQPRSRSHAGAIVLVQYDKSTGGNWRERRRQWHNRCRHLSRRTSLNKSIAAYVVVGLAVFMAAGSGPGNAQQAPARGGGAPAGQGARGRGPAPTDTLGTGPAGPAARRGRRPPRSVGAPRRGH